MSINGTENTNLKVGLDIVAQRKTQVGVLEGERTREIYVKPESMLSTISQRLTLLINFKSQRSISAADIEKYLVSLIVYRVQQIEGNCKLRAADVYVPSFFYPVLAGLGRFEDPRRALALIPTSSDPAPMQPEEMYEFGFMLAASCVKVERGLPRLLTVDSDAIYRVENANGELRVAGEDVGELVLLLRTVLDCTFYAEVFGAARTRYLSVEDSGMAWDAILGLAVD